jgi:hypothetical protein
VLRCCAAGIKQTTTQFRCVNGWLRLPALCVALNRRVAPHTVGTTGQDEL